MAKAKKKVRKVCEHARVHIAAKWNNTIVTMTDLEGNVLVWSSSGACGFKGARQSTPYAGQMAAEQVAEKAAAYGTKTTDVILKGMGPGRDQTVRGLMNGGLTITSITDMTRVPHGGCRSKRVRKV